MGTYKHCKMGGGVGTAAARRDRAALIFFGPFYIRIKKDVLKKYILSFSWKEGKYAKKTQGKHKRSACFAGPTPPPVEFC